MATGELGELPQHVDVKIIDERTAELLPYLQALAGALAIGGALDLEQRIDPAHDLDRDRRERDFLLAGGLAPRILFEIGNGEERTPAMRPAGRFPDRPRMAPRKIELVVAVIGVGLQDAGIPRQMR